MRGGKSQRMKLPMTELTKRRDQDSNLARNGKPASLHGEPHFSHVTLTKRRDQVAEFSSSRKGFEPT